MTASGRSHWIRLFRAAPNWAKKLALRHRQGRCGFPASRVVATPWPPRVSGRRQIDVILWNVSFVNDHGLANVLLPGTPAFGFSGVAKRKRSWLAAKSVRIGREEKARFASSGASLSKSYCELRICKTPPQPNGSYCGAGVLAIAAGPLPVVDKALGDAESSAGGVKLSTMPMPFVAFSEMNTK